MWFSACQYMLQPALPNGKTSAVSAGPSTALLASVWKKSGSATGDVQRARDEAGKTATAAASASDQRRRGCRPPSASHDAQISPAINATNSERRTGRIARVTG